jgi:Pyruvate/2-oxoacid:ferredoxin oxidoreductase delta subunit/flavodoxin
MKIALLYFSGTGITAKYATDIASGFIKANHTVNLLRIKRGAKFNLAQYDIIGVGAPAYSYRAPRIVTRFLRKLDFHRKPFFVFSTSGGVPGNTLWNLYKAIYRKAGVFLGSIEGFGITNIRSWMPKISDTKQKLGGLTNHDCEMAQEFSEKVLDRLTRWKRIPNKMEMRSLIPDSNLWYYIWAGFFTWRFEMAFYVGFKLLDKEKCNSCKLCATKICPSGAITLKRNDMPRFNEFRCVGCSGCVNLCPKDAIWTFRSKNHRQYDLYKDYILKN